MYNLRFLFSCLLPFAVLRRVMAEQKVAEIIVESIYNAGVRVVFGIPGAKVDAIFDTLTDHPEIKLVVCRSESMLKHKSHSLSKGSL